MFRKPKDSDGISLSHTFTVTESFDQPNGKFGDNLGNAIVIDCQYIDDYYSAAMLSQYPLMSLLFSTDEKPLSIIDVNFCNMSLAINGVLED